MRRQPLQWFSPILLLLLLLTACGGGANSNVPVLTNQSRLASKQILTLPNVGIEDSSPLDPALVTDPNSSLIINMVYSGLVRADANLNVVPDQATWDISPNYTVYTFHIKPDVAFSDGTPVTAETYVYTLTRALLPTVQSNMADLFEGVIVGANDVIRGKTQVLRGVKALDTQTLQITLTQSAPYFLQMLTNAIYFPVNKQLIDTYGQSDWGNHVVAVGAGTGPFMITEWDHSLKMILVPNPHYYGPKPRLSRVNMLFAGDASTAFKTYRAGQYDLVWNIAASDQLSAKGLSGFTRVTMLKTDALFFNSKMPPFDNPVIRQAFAFATDKATLAHTVFSDSVVPAATILPPGMSGYQPNYSGIPFDKTRAKALIQSIYPDVTTVPPIVFSYSNSQMTQQEASALQQMWQSALGVSVRLRPVETTAYTDELNKHLVQFGFTQWDADFPDPYDCLTLNLLSTQSNNIGEWSNPAFDQMVQLADKTSGDLRIALYNQAEQIAIQDVGWLPLDHATLTAVIPSWVQGVKLNAEGLYFGDWSGVYMLQH